MGERPLARRFGTVVRQRRLEAGLSQEEFADRCGLHRTYIGAIERAEKNVTLETAARVASALDFQLHQLVREAELIE